MTGDPFEALGDPQRRAIVELLHGGGRSVQDIADALPISRPAVSRHLRLLKDAGLVVSEPRGTRRLYRLHDEGIEAVQAYLEQVWGEAAARFRLRGREHAGGDRAAAPRRSPWRARPSTPSRRGPPAPRCGGRAGHTVTGEQGARDGPRAALGRADLRADNGRARGRTGARSCSGSRRAGWATCGTCAPTAPTRPRSRSTSRPGRRRPPGWRSSTAAGTGWARARRLARANRGGWSGIIPTYVAACTG